MALILKLPTAAATPIQNPARRGRLPRGIISIRKARDARHDLREEIADQAILVDTLRGAIATLQRELVAAQAQSGRLQRTAEKL